MKRDDVIAELIAAYSQTMHANNDNDEAMRMINAMADRVIVLFEREQEEREN